MKMSKSNILLATCSLADACLYLLEQPEDKLAGLFNNEQPPLVNIGCGEDLTIRKLAS
jgi:GDP-L-fucose synthase